MLSFLSKHSVGFDWWNGNLFNAYKIMLDIQVKMLQVGAKLIKLQKISKSCKSDQNIMKDAKVIRKLFESIWI